MSDEKIIPEKVGKRIACVVEKGRTVVQEGKYYLAGTTVLLDKAEAFNLCKAGFLVDPYQEPLPVADGPTFTTDAGPAILPQ